MSAAAKDGCLGRLATATVAGLFAVAVGFFGWPFGGLGAALGIGIAGGGGLAFLLVRLRRHSPLRRASAAILGVYLVVMVSWAVGGGELEPAGPLSTPERADWPSLQLFSAGVGEAAFDLPERAVLAGWGHPPRRITAPAFGGLGVLGRASLELMGPPAPGQPPRVPIFRRPENPGQELGAKALVFMPESEGIPMAIVRLDLIESSAELAAAVAARVEDLGFEPTSVLVAATHTHSGPGGFLRSTLAEVVGTDHFDADVFEALADAGAEAIHRAASSAQPARIAFAGSRDRDGAGRPILARNRRSADPEAIDDRVWAIRLEPRTGGEPLAVLVNYAVHPTFHQPTHLAFDRDVPGAIEDALAARFPGRPLVLFVNGAEGDVTYRRPPKGDPRERRDLTSLADAFADRVADELMVGPGYERLSIRAGRVWRDLGTPYSWAALGSGESFVEDVVPGPLGRGPGGLVAALLSLPVNLPIWALGIPELRLGFSFRGSAGVVLDLERALDPETFAFGSWVLEASSSAAAGAGESAPREASRTVLWYPGEATQAVGRRWQEAAEAEGHPPAMIFSFTGGALGYVASAEEYMSGEYEARSTLFGPGTAARAQEALLASLPEPRPKNIE